MATKQEIHSFALKYFNLYNDPETEEREVIEGFGEQCFALGFEMDCGEKFIEKYAEEAFHNCEKLANIIDTIDDIDVLASGIFSRWRYTTYWEGGSLLDDNDYRTRFWFWFAFCQLAIITDDSYTKKKGND